ncbi:MAG TPA: DUF4382 domain-containing protein [Steroidobacteraceae bacterium]|nr:DUF4382 domain-containing protein [Steroidobacteraceae bacterium]
MSNSFRLLSLCVSAALLAACGGGSGGSSSSSVGSTSQTSTAQSANLAVMVSDASSQDWATIGVKIISIALIPQGGGADVTVYSAPSPVPTTNLVLLDQLDELLGNTSIPAGTYSGAVLTVSGNPGDILLTTATNPQAGFAAAPSTTIPSSEIQVQHTQGSAPNLTVPVTVSFDSPLTVSATQSNALDLEFDLAHPAFLIGHVPAAGGPTLWAVNFEGPVRRLPRYDLTRLVLRHTYGDVTAISSDDSSITITKEFPTEPPVSPETAIAGTRSLQITADSVNGTIFYDLDARTRTVIDDFSSQSSLVGRYVRIAARYQQDGTLVATRIWASSEFNNVWLSPEGHVLHVDTSSDVITVENESGVGVALTVDANTQFFFREPYDPAVDSKPIATGTAFLANEDLVRGFKVHATVVDPLATPLVAQSIDIETARYDGAISAPGSTSFTYTSKFLDVADDYVYTMSYISSSTANGKDYSGNPISGYLWWNFAYPTLLMDGADAVSEFIAATGGSVDFGGTAGAVPSYGVSFATWNDPANPNGWAARASILTPALLPLGQVATGLSGGSFTMTVAGGSMPVTVDVSTVSGSATLVYQVDRTNGVVTVSPVDITTSAGLDDLTGGLAAGAPVRVYGTPQADSTLKAYVITYFTGEMPSN